MTPLPKRKISTRRKGKRRANHSLSLPNLIKCKHCNSLKIFRNICPSCGKK